MNTKQPLKHRFYRWVASWLPQDLIYFAMLRAFMAVASRVNVDGEMYEDMAVSDLFQRWLNRAQERKVWLHTDPTRDPKWSIWRAGRAWFHIYSSTLRAEWCWFDRGLNWWDISLTVAADEDDIKFSLKIPRVVSVWLAGQYLPVLRRFIRNVRSGYGYETAISWSEGALRIHVIHCEAWGSRSVKAWWLPRWISIWKSSGYKEYPGVGFYVSFNFDYLILGNHERTEENISDPVRLEIPIEPDNSFGLHYYASFQRQRETRWRSHFPGRKRVAEYIYVSTDNPPLHAGKGENDWDMDDDGIMGTSYVVGTFEEAVKKYMEACQRDRKKYGMPDALWKLPEFQAWHAAQELARGAVLDESIES